MTTHSFLVLLFVSLLPAPEESAGIVLLLVTVTHHHLCAKNKYIDYSTKHGGYTLFFLIKIKCGQSLKKKI